MIIQRGFNAGPRPTDIRRLPQVLNDQFIFDLTIDQLQGIFHGFFELRKEVSHWNAGVIWMTQREKVMC